MICESQSNFIVIIIISIFLLINRVQDKRKKRISDRFGVRETQKQNNNKTVIGPYRDQEACQIRLVHHSNDTYMTVRLR